MANVRTHAILLTLLLAAAQACRPAAPTTATPPPRGPEPEPAAPLPAAPLRIGLILPVNGSPDLVEYGSLIREGVELALAQYSGNGGRRIVELLIRDDSGDAATAARAAAELERDGVIAIIGPLLSESVEAAAAGRSNRDLLILSPTASALPSSAEHTYSLNTNDSRAGFVLANWAVASGLSRVAVLHATTPDSRADARTFVEQARARGAQVVAEIPFDPGATSFGSAAERLKATDAQAVFVPASERDVRQIAPQLAYFGLTNVQILGTESWVSDDVLRAVPASVLEGVVAAVPLIEGGGETEWADFVRLYERTQRRTLDNPYPALGYDAANLVLREIVEGRTRPTDVADAVAGLENFRGATGVLSIADGRVWRRPFLVRVRSGKPEPVSTGGGS